MCRGAAYYRQVTQWDRCEFAGCTNSQDDLAVMESRGGLVRATGAGTSLATATPLALTPAGSNIVGTYTGVVAQPSTTYFHKFSAGAGTASVSVAVLTPYGSQSRANLDVELIVLTSSGAQLASPSPAAGLAASTSVSLPTAGEYVVGVRGTGHSSPSVDGYSAYGSLGQYDITVTFPVPPTAVPSPSPEVPSPSPSPS